MRRTVRRRLHRRPAPRCLACDAVQSQRLRNVRRRQFLRGSGVVTHGAYAAGFVFDLHHNHRVLGAIHLADVAHQRSECVLVRAEIRP